MVLAGDLAMTQPTGAVPTGAPSSTSPNPSSTEPAVSVGAVTAVATGILGILVMLGVPMSSTLRDAILSVLATVAPLIAGWLIRRKVYSPASVAKLLAAARAGRSGPL